MPFEDTLALAKTTITMSHPFWSVISLNSRYILDETFPTYGATDCHKTIILNPRLCGPLTKKKLLGLIIHEISHIVFMHEARRESRDHELWNIACDFAVNPMIKDEFGYDLPDGGCYDPKYRGMSAEDIYTLFMQDQRERERVLSLYGKGGSVGRMDTHLPFPSGKVDEVRDTIAIAHAVWSSIPEGKLRGTLTAGVIEYVKMLLKPQVPWQRKLHRFAGQALAKNDYTWLPPNRRYLPYDICMPTLRSLEAGSIAFCVDSSGSISDRQLEAFAPEMVRVANLVEECTVLVHDSIVQQVIKPKDIPAFLKNIHFKGRGGTDHRPVFLKIKELGLHPDLFIGLTDGASAYPPKKPPYPVLWCLTKEHHKPPWGERIFIDI